MTGDISNRLMRWYFGGGPEQAAEATNALLKGATQGIQDMRNAATYMSRNSNWDRDPGVAREVGRQAFWGGFSPIAGGGAIGHAAQQFPKAGSYVGTFGGRLAKTADHAALARAESMADAGASPKDIWNETGWFQGADGKWRFEIDDSGMKILATGVNSGRLGDVIEHNALFQAYPELANTRATVGVDPSSYEAFNSPWPGIGKIKSVMPTDIETRKALAHELQHSIQGKEGFAKGGSWVTERRPWLSEEDAYNNYMSISGEVEARNVSDRLGYTERAPFETMDRPFNEQTAGTPALAVYKHSPFTSAMIGSSLAMLYGLSTADDEQQTDPASYQENENRLMRGVTY